MTLPAVLHLVLRLRMRGAIPPPRLSALHVAYLSTGTTVLCYISLDKIYVLLSHAAYEI
jgi:hypothetical protein